MTSAAPARKPYRKAPPQHRETRHGPPAAPPQPDLSQVNKRTLHLPTNPTQHLSYSPRLPRGCVQPPPLRPSDSDLDISSLSSLELRIPPPPLFSSPAHRTGRTGITVSEKRPTSPLHGPGPRHGLHLHCSRKTSPSAGKQHGSVTELNQHRTERRRRPQATTHVTATPPRGILKQPVSQSKDHAYDTIRKSKSVELLDDARHRPSFSLDRTEQRASAQSSATQSPHRNTWNWRMQVLQEKARFSDFLDEITCRVLSPARLSLLGQAATREPGSPARGRSRRRLTQGHQRAESADRTRRWDDWVASLRWPDSWYSLLKEEGVGHSDMTQGHKGEEPRAAKMKAEMKEHQRLRASLCDLSLLSQIKVGVRLLLLPPWLLLVYPGCTCWAPPEDLRRNISVTSSDYPQHRRRLSSML